MKEKFLDFTQKHFTGITHIKMTDKLYFSFARLSPYFTSAFLMMGLGDIYNSPIVFYASIPWMLYCTYCFFFLRIHKKRQFNGLTRL